MIKLRNVKGQFLKNYKLQKRRKAAQPEKLAGVTHVCWLAPPPDDMPHAAWLGRTSGLEKCRDAHFVITYDIAKLSDCQTLSTNGQLVIDVIYILALGNQ